MESKEKSFDESIRKELEEAKAHIKELQKKIALLEDRVPHKYPEVKYLGYKDRKRILVGHDYLIRSNHTKTYAVLCMTGNTGPLV